MGSSAYPAMSQPFSMSHSSNMSSVGVRQDSMSKNILNLISFRNINGGNYINL